MQRLPFFIVKNKSTLAGRLIFLSQRLALTLPALVIKETVCKENAAIGLYSLMAINHDLTNYLIKFF
jgi:hypothetical protein